MGGIPALDVTAGTTLGAKLVSSAVYFQAAAANLFGSMGSDLQTLVAAVSSGSLSFTGLPEVNRQIENTTGAVCSIQKSLQSKIEAGVQIHGGPIW